MSVEGRGLGILAQERNVMRTRSWDGLGTVMALVVAADMATDLYQETFASRYTRTSQYSSPHHLAVDFPPLPSDDAIDVSGSSHQL